MDVERSSQPVEVQQAVGLQPPSASLLTSPSLPLPLPPTPLPSNSPSVPLPVLGVARRPRIPVIALKRRPQPPLAIARLRSRSSSPRPTPSPPPPPIPSPASPRPPSSEQLTGAPAAAPSPLSAVDCERSASLPALSFPTAPLSSSPYPSPSPSPVPPSGVDTTEATLQVLRPSSRECPFSFLQFVYSYLADPSVSEINTAEEWMQSVIPTQMRGREGAVMGKDEVEAQLMEMKRGTRPPPPIPTSVFARPSPISQSASLQLLPRLAPLSVVAQRQRGPAEVVRADDGSHQEGEEEPPQSRPQPSVVAAVRHTGESMDDVDDGDEVRELSLPSAALPPLPRLSFQTSPIFRCPLLPHLLIPLRSHKRKCAEMDADPVPIPSSLPSHPLSPPRSSSTIVQRDTRIEVDHSVYTILRLPHGTPTPLPGCREVSRWGGVS